MMRVFDSSDHRDTPWEPGTSNVGDRLSASIVNSQMAHPLVYAKDGNHQVRSAHAKRSHASSRSLAYDVHA